MPPFVTVIMPVRNEADFIARSLGTVLKQDYPHDKLEVIIADGNSTDNTVQIIEAIRQENPIPIILIQNPKQIVPSGFNLALQSAQGEIIVRVDGHCEIAPDYVSQCVRKLQENPVAGVGGPIETISQNQIGTAIALAMSSQFGVGASAFRTIKNKSLLVDTIAFPAYWRRIMDAVGYLDEEMVRNQDDEYNYRLRALGHKLLLSPDIKSRYYSRTSLSKLWKQYYQYGFYKVRVLQKHPRQMSLRQFIPPAFVLTVLLGALVAPFLWQVRLLWLALLSLYVLANLTASSIVAYRTKGLYLLLLPPIFAILHFSYGAGFLHGLLKFRHYWKQP